jgi:hypothetical protein
VKTLTGVFTGAPNGLLTLTLSEYALLGVVPKPLIAINAPKSYQFRLTGSGFMPGGARIWANDELIPEGTFYRATVTDILDNLVFGPQDSVVCGPTPIDLNQSLGIEVQTMAFNTVGFPSDNMLGQPNPNVLALLYTSFDTVVFPANFSSPNSYGSFGALPTGTAVYSVLLSKSGIDSEVGSVTITPNGVFTFQSPGFTMNPSDRLQLITPSPADPTLADVAITLVGVRIT